jgi:hypothetical protein
MTRFRRSHVVFAFLIVPAVLAIAVRVSHGSSTATDHGSRGGPPGAGGPLPGLTQQESQQFHRWAKQPFRRSTRFRARYLTRGSALGPRFNMNGCAGCHNSPAPRGSSPQVNPRINAATLNGATNSIPFFITPSGPILRAFLIVDTNPPHYRALATSQIVTYKHNQAGGRATVMWTSIVGDQVQSGFRYLPG